MVSPSSILLAGVLAFTLYYVSSHWEEINNLFKRIEEENETNLKRSEAMVATGRTGSVPPLPVNVNSSGKNQNKY
jgi:hypothetical protein